MTQPSIEIDGLPFGYEQGWLGAFTRAHVAGAMPNGTPIEKAKCEAGDGNPNGTPGVILGSISHPDVCGGVVLYFVEWANHPRRAVAVVDWKIKASKS